MNRRWLLLLLLLPIGGILARLVYATAIFPGGVYSHVYPTGPEPSPAPPSSVYPRITMTKLAEEIMAVETFIQPYVGHLLFNNDTAPSVGEIVINDTTAGQTNSSACTASGNTVSCPAATTTGGIVRLKEPSAQGANTWTVKTADSPTGLAVNKTITLNADGTMPLGGNFAGTSADLAGAITDESGTGPAIFGTDPQLTNPTMAGTPSFIAASDWLVMGTPANPLAGRQRVYAASNGNGLCTVDVSGAQRCTLPVPPTGSTSSWSCSATTGGLYIDTDCMQWCVCNQGQAKWCRSDTGVCGSATDCCSATATTTSSTTTSSTGGTTSSTTTSTTTSTTAPSGSFPQSDTFNRADGGLGSNWTSGWDVIVSLNAPVIQTNEIIESTSPSTAGAAGYYNPAFLPANDSYSCIKLSGHAAAVSAGAACIFLPGSSDSVCCQHSYDQRLWLWYEDNGGAAVITCPLGGASPCATPSDGLTANDYLAIRRTNATTFQCFYATAAAPNTWVAFGSPQTISNIATGGYGGVYLYESASAATALTITQFEVGTGNLPASAACGLNSPGTTTTSTTGATTSSTSSTTTTTTSTTTSTTSGASFPQSDRFNRGSLGSLWTVSPSGISSNLPVITSNELIESASPSAAGAGAYFNFATLATDDSYTCIKLAGHAAANSAVAACIYIPGSLDVVCCQNTWDNNLHLWWADNGTQTDSCPLGGTPPNCNITLSGMAIGDYLAIKRTNTTTFQCYHATAAAPNTWLAFGSSLTINNISSGGNGGVYMYEAASNATCTTIDDFEVGTGALPTAAACGTNGTVH